MGVFDMFQKSSKPHQEMLVPQAVSQNEFPEKQLEQDLAKLKEFEKKIGKDNSTEEVTTPKQSAQISQEEMALRLQNPFRGI